MLSVKIMFAILPFCAIAAVRSAPAPLILEGNDVASKQIVTTTLAPATATASGAKPGDPLNDSGPTKSTIQSSDVPTENGDNGTEQATGFCTTSGCREVRQLIEKSINRDADPCEDFEEFACGTWRADRNKSLTEYASVTSEAQLAINNVLAEALRAVVRFRPFRHFVSSLEQAAEDDKPESDESRANRQACDFFVKCKEFSDATVLSSQQRTVLRFISDFAPWPILSTGATWNSEQFDLNKVIGDLHKRLGLSPFLRPYTDVDWTNRTRNAIYLNVGNLGKSQAYFLNRTRYPLSMFARKYTVDVSLTKLMEAVRLNGTGNAWIATSAADSIVDFEQELARNLKPSSRADMHNHVALDSLMPDEDGGFASKESQNNFDPRKALRSALFDVEWSWLEAAPKTNTLTVESPENLRFLTQMLNRTPKHVTANYLLWRLLVELTPYLGSDFSAAASYSVEQKGECLNRLNRFFPEVADNLIRQNAWKSEIASQATALTNELRKAAKSMLQNSFWLSAKSKARAIKKLENIAFHLGPPKRMPIASPFSGYSFSDSLFENYLALLNESQAANAMEISQPVKRNQFTDRMSIVNGFNYKSLNLVAVPAAQLLKPFLGTDYPEFFNFGRAGATIAHEIGHSFDPTGVLYDHDGVFKPQWILDEYSAVNYKKLSERVADKYSESCFDIALEDAVTGKSINKSVCVDGSNTLIENAADIFGINAAFQAYNNILSSSKTVAQSEGLRLHGLTEYSPQQLFFIAYGTSWCSAQSNSELLHQLSDDKHSPDATRVNVVLRNMPAFSKAFKCKRRHAMFSTDNEAPKA